MPKDEVTTGQKLKDGFASLAQAGKDAAVVAKKQAELKKIQTVDLSKAYYQLGKSLYANGIVRKQFPELHSQIGELQVKIKDLKSKIANQPKVEKVTQKAKQVAVATKQKAEIKGCQLQTTRLLANLGNEAFDAHSGQVGPSELAAPIVESLRRIDQLKQELQALEDSSKGRFLTPKRVLIGAACLAGLILFGVIGSIIDKDDKTDIENGTANVTSSQGQAPTGRLPSELKPKDTKPFPLHSMLKELQAVKQGNQSQLRFSPKGNYACVVFGKPPHRQPQLSPRLWNVRTGAEIIPQNGDVDYFSLPAAFSPSEDSIACLDGDFIRIWSIKENKAKLICSERLHSDFTAAETSCEPHVQWYDAEKVLVSNRPDTNYSRNYLVLSSFENGRTKQAFVDCIRRGISIKGDVGSSTNPTAVVSPDGRHLVFGFKGKFQVQEFDSGKVVKEFSVGRPIGWTYEFGIDDELRVSGLYENHDPAPAMAFTQDGKHFLIYANGSRNGSASLVVLNTDSWSQAGAIEIKDSQIVLCLSSDSRMLATLELNESRTSQGAQYAYEAKVFDLQNGKVVSNVSLGDEFGFSDWCLKEAGRRFAAFSHDNSSLVIFLSDKGGWNDKWQDGFRSGRAENPWAVGAWSVANEKREWLITKTASQSGGYGYNSKAGLLSMFNGSHEIIDTKAISSLVADLKNGDKLWAEGKIDNAFDSYRKVISHPENQFLDGKIQQVFARCIDYYGKESDTPKGRQVIDFMLEHQMKIEPETGKGQELVRLYQNEKTETQNELIAANRKAQAEQLKQLRQENKSRFAPASSMTTASFIGKLKGNLSGGRLDQNVAQAVYQNYTFQDVFGDPDSNIAWNNNGRLIQFNCSDGSVQMVAAFGGGNVWITEISTY